MKPRDPKAFAARFPQVVFERSDARVVAFLNGAHQIGFVVEGRRAADAMGVAGWDRGEVSKERVTAVLCEALEAFVAAAADRASSYREVDQLEALVR